MNTRRSSYFGLVLIAISASSQIACSRDTPADPPAPTATVKPSATAPAPEPSAAAEDPSSPVRGGFAYVKDDLGLPGFV